MKIDDTQQRVTLVQAYKESVLIYEELHKRVEKLFQAGHGHTADLTDEDYIRYRELADLRDLAYNRMKTLEHTLFDDSEG